MSPTRKAAGPGHSVQTFIELIGDELEKGCSFVPLIGAGLSLASGIPISRDLKCYLNNCLSRVASPSDSWDPRSYEWPEWKECTQAPNRCTDQLRIDGTDWRASLQFLSTVKKENGQLIPVPPDNGVITAFFRFVTKGCRPSAAHILLAHLIEPLRVKTILTTNFDALIEEALRSLGIDVQTFDVHLNAGLPAHQSVLEAMSVVKLHGGRYGLRADFTLDDSPSSADKKEFAGYLRDWRHFGNGDAARSPSAGQHLLVVGYSGEDQRTKELIASAMHEIKDLQLFWVCFSKGRQEEIEAKFAKYQSRLHTIVHRDPGLLYLEMYHALTHSLPPAGSPYPTKWLVPPSPYSPGEHSQAFQRYRKQLSDMIAQMRDDTSKRFGIVCGQPGISSLAADVFEDIRSGWQCIWLSLDDYENDRGARIALVEAIARQVGEEDTMGPVSFGETIDLKEYLDRSRNSNRFLVFLNCRDGLGTRSGLLRTQSSSEPATLACFLKMLIETASDERIALVVIMREKGELSLCPTGEVEVKEQVFSGNPVSIANNAMKWLRTVPQAAEFLYSLTLFRHSCITTAFLAPLFVDSPLSLRDDRRMRFSNQVQIWMEKLIDLEVLRAKPGGHVWMHETLREELYRRSRTNKRRKAGTAKCHQAIADWYLKLFRSSRDLSAALESVYHRFQCAEAANNGEVSDELEGFSLTKSAIVEADRTLALANSRLLASGNLTTRSAQLGVVEAHFNRESADRSEVVHLRNTCRRLRVQLAESGMRYRDAQTLLEADGPPWDGDGGIREDGNPNWERQYRAAIALIGQRAYDPAVGRLRGLLDEDMDKAVFVNPSRDPAASVASWGGTKSEVQLRRTVRVLKGLTYLEALIGQAHNNVEEHDMADTKFEAAQLCYEMACEVIRYISNPDFVECQYSHLNVHYCLVLSELGRFADAHNALNEASASLALSSQWSDPLCRAVLELRRAETYLRQAEAVSEVAASHEKRRLADAYVDRAHFSLTSARKLLAGERRALWWWNWLYELEIRLCVQLAQNPPQDISCAVVGDGNLICSTPTRTYLKIDNALRRITSTDSKDLLRQARLVELVRNLEKLTKRSTTEETIYFRRLLRETAARLRELMEDGRKPSPLVVQYAEAVLNAPCSSS